MTGRFTLGQTCKITDPGAVWDRGHVVTVIGHYHGWPVIRGSGNERVINPQRLKPVRVRKTTPADDQPSLF